MLAGAAPPDPLANYRALAVAVIGRAIQDSIQGDLAARTWLTSPAEGHPWFTLAQVGPFTLTQLEGLTLRRFQAMMKKELRDGLRPGLGPDPDEIDPSEVCDLH